MKFFKKLKSSILGSVKEDLNSALKGKQMLFNSKISGALDDLISMKTGINISNIPTKITEMSAIEAEARRERASRGGADAFGIVEGKELGDGINGPLIAFSPPEDRGILRFPTDDTRYVDNWMIIRTVKRKIDADNVLGTGKAKSEHGKEYWDKTQMGKYGFTFSAVGTKAWNTQCTIALYFPNNVKDTVSVEYEQTEVGIGDTILNSMFGKGGAGIIETVPKAGQEAFKGVMDKMISVRAMEEGVASNNPKFTNFNGVSLRDHTYTFNLNPYNANDSRAIRDIIEKLKMYSLPAMSAKNSRLKILPAEFSIDFQGPILGHIEHPQNCYLSSVDVDYSGGKDMSFIEEVSETVTQVSETKLNEDGTETREEYDQITGELQHYPNGITLTLTFKEILQLNRQRYMNRVAASAMGNKQKDTVDSIYDDAYHGTSEMSDPDVLEEGESRTYWFGTFGVNDNNYKAYFDEEGEQIPGTTIRHLDGGNFTRKRDGNYSYTYNRPFGAP